VASTLNQPSDCPTNRDHLWRLSVPDNTITNWVRAYRQGKLAEVGKNQRQLSETEVELARLRRELAQVKMERDILKKAAAYFARESQEGTR